MSIGFQSWSRSLADSPQVTEAINPAVGCHYFPPGPRLPPQPPSINAYWPVPNYTAWWQRHMCKQLAQVAGLTIGYWLWIFFSPNYDDGDADWCCCCYWWWHAYVFYWSCPGNVETLFFLLLLMLKLFQHCLSIYFISLQCTIVGYWRQRADERIGNPPPR